jgi:hypothetical protein
MIAGLACRVRKEQGTEEALRSVAVGVIELERGLHAQPLATDRDSIMVTKAVMMSMPTPGNGPNPAMTSSRLIDIPRIKSGVSGNVGREVGKRYDRLLIERTKIGGVPSFISSIVPS